MAQGFSPAFLLLLAVFCLLAVMNSGGYRYGASDQAFYIPAINARIDPALFPRDRPLIAAHGGLIVFDDGVAWLARASGWPLPSIFLAAFAAGLAALGIAFAVTGASFYQSRWTVAALVLAMTLRHRIPRTGVNTLEGYLQPRMLAFAAGVFAVAALLGQRPWTALGCVAVAGLIHPTTALWFAVLLGVAIIVDVPHLRRGMAAAAAVGGAVVIWMVAAGPLRERLVTMDGPWLAAVQSKDYLFPAGWPLADWIVNLGYAVLIVVLFRVRRGAGVARPGERGLAAGSLALLALFLASVPLTMMHVALAVQLQVSRVFWILDLMATLLVVWLVAESGRPALRRAMTVALIVGASAFVRGAYVMRVAHPERALVERDLPRDDWTAVMARVAQMPASTHVLADPGHAWRYGTSVRVAASRDVYLEEVKDSALAMYSREVAERVVSRVGDLPDFSTLTADSARAVAVKYGLDVLVIDRDLPLPEMYRNGRFRIYRFH